MDSLVCVFQTFTSSSLYAVIFLFMDTMDAPASLPLSFQTAFVDVYKDMYKLYVTQ